jgi:hypothetical protein
MDEDEVIIWQDVLDDVAAGRVVGLTCPFCKKGEIKVDRQPQRTRLECASCKRFIEGRMAE